MTAAPFCNVRGNRYRRAADLAAQTKSFGRRKGLRAAIALLDDVHRLFPCVEIAVTEDLSHAAGQARSMPCELAKKVAESRRTVRKSAALAMVHDCKCCYVPAPRSLFPGPESLLPRLGSQAPSPQPLVPVLIPSPQSPDPVVDYCHESIRCDSDCYLSERQRVRACPGGAGVQDCDGNGAGQRPGT